MEDIRDIICTKCKHTGPAGGKAVEMVSMGVAVTCPNCNMKTAHGFPVEETSAEDDAIELLNQHVVEHHADATAMYPTGCEECVIGTYDTGEVEFFSECCECHKRVKIPSEEAFEDQIVCERCKDMTARSFEIEPIIRAIISLQRLHKHFKEEFKDAEDPGLAAREWIDYNVTGAYMGPGTPLYVNEVRRD